MQKPSKKCIIQTNKENKYQQLEEQIDNKMIPKNNKPDSNNNQN